MRASSRLYSGQSGVLERPKIDYKTLDLQRQKSVATVALTGHTLGNLIDAETAAELKELCGAVSQDDGIRLLIIAGSGGFFSAGRASPPQDLLAEGRDELARWLSRMQVASAVADLTIPVVAVVQGDAFDHGLELALAADIRIASEAARFALTDLANGRFPWDGRHPEAAAAGGSSLGQGHDFYRAGRNGRRVPWASGWSTGWPLKTISGRRWSS